MARPTTLANDQDIPFAQALLARAKSVEDMRMAQSVLMPALFKVSMKETAQMLGVCERTVTRLRHDLRNKRLGTYQEDAGAADNARP